MTSKNQGYPLPVIYQENEDLILKLRGTEFH